MVGADKPLGLIGERTVAGTKPFGKGSVTVIGFGTRFTDTNYGVTGDINPDAELMKVYEVQYGLLRWIMNGEIGHR